MARTPNAANTTRRFSTRGIKQAHFLSCLANMPTMAIIMPTGAAQNPIVNAVGMRRRKLESSLLARAKAMIPVAYAKSDTTRHPSDTRTNEHRILSLFSFLQNVSVQVRRTLCAVTWNALLDSISRLFIPWSYLKSWLRGRCGFCCRCGRSIDRADTHYFFNPTSRFRRDPRHYYIRL